MIPEPYYTLINTSRGEDPAVVVVNSALRSFDGREAFSWHLKLTVGCKLLGANGMPTAQEIEILNHWEAEISAPLQAGQNAVFLARITCRGERELLYRVRDPELANATLQQLVAPSSQLREWDYEMKQDAGWALAQPELTLLERDSRFS